MSCIENLICVLKLINPETQTIKNTYEYYSTCIVRVVLKITNRIRQIFTQLKRQYMK